jgi:hypothetical protein
MLLPALRQQSEIDSMLQKAEMQQGEEKVNSLINISRQYFIMEDTLAIYYGRRSHQFVS